MAFRSVAPAAALAVALLLPACEGSNQPDSAAPPASTTPAPSLTLDPEPSEEPDPQVTSDPEPPSRPPPPGPSFTIPKRAGPLALLLVRNHRSLYRSIEEWRESRGGQRRVSLEALLQQRVFRVLGRDQALADAVLPRLPAGIRRSSESNLAAVRALLSLVTPIEPPIDLQPRRPAPAQELLRYYGKGQRRTGIPWELLASVNFVETRFGRILGPSTAGALGPMQFLPSTWEQYGDGGDIMDPHDSILAAARYLSASGAPTDTRGALFAYNRSYEYVDAIQIYAREMMRDERAFYGYYFWQVFVSTTRGDVQLTGPGSR